MQSHVLGHALRLSHREKRSRSLGLFSRYAQVTRPPKSMQTGINRVMYDVGRYGVPIAGGYYGGKYLGLWGQDKSPYQSMQQLVPNEVSFGNRYTEHSPYEVHLGRGRMVQARYS